MAGRFFRLIVVASGLLLPLIGTGCSQVVETLPIDVTAYGPESACQSTLGAYYLPRALIRFKASKDDSAGTLTGTLNSPPLNFVPDRAQPLCLDYLSLATSRDIVTVQRDPSTGLLVSISSDVTDRTPQIINSLVATAANATLAAARQASLTTSDTLDIEFDPFVASELAAAKTAMRRFGFCLYVEGHSFPAAGLDAGGVLAAAQRWCNASGLPPYDDPAEQYSALPVPMDAVRSGVLYRPNMTHKIVILNRKDPGAGPWTLYQIRRIDMPNVSPVLSIGVERAIFTERQTTLNFNEGILTDVAVNKKSELVGFVQIPLAVAQAIATIPQQIVTLRISDVNNHAALLYAQNSLIQAVSTYKQTVASNPLPAGVPQSANLRGGLLTGNCLDGHGPPEVCTQSGNQ